MSKEKVKKPVIVDMEEIRRQIQNHLKDSSYVVILTDEGAIKIRRKGKDEAKS